MEKTLDKCIDCETFLIDPSNSIPHDLLIVNLNSYIATVNKYKRRIKNPVRLKTNLINFKSF